MRGLNGVLIAGRDSHMCTDLLLRHDVGVILTGPFTFPKRADGAYDQVYSLGALLVDATLTVMTGTPLEVTTHVTHAFIQGRRIDLSNKQTKLNDKYRERYRQIDGNE